MKDALTIPTGERGIVRVFALSVEAGDENALKAPGAAAAALGVATLDMEHVDIFAASDLAGVGLADYLVDGFGVPEAEVAPDRARLEAVRGLVIVVRSRAFGGQAVTLHPAGQLQLVGSFRESGVDWTPGAPLESASARGSAGGGLSPRARRSRTRAVGAAVFAAFVLLVLAIVLLVVL